mgnify:CR=1 FL=1
MELTKTAIKHLISHVLFSLCNGCTWRSEPWMCCKLHGNNLFCSHLCHSSVLHLHTDEFLLQSHPTEDLMNCSAQILVAKLQMVQMQPGKSVNEKSKLKEIIDLVPSIYYIGLYISLKTDDIWQKLEHTCQDKILEDNFFSIMITKQVFLPFPHQVHPATKIMNLVLINSEFSKGLFKYATFIELGALYCWMANRALYYATCLLRVHVL